MPEIAIITFTGLCLFVRAAGSPDYTVHLISHDPVQDVAMYSHVPEHKAFVKVSYCDVSWSKTKRQPTMSQPEREFAVFFIEPSEHLFFSGAQDSKLTTPTINVPPKERKFSRLPSFRDICSDSTSECGRLDAAGTAEVKLDRGQLFSGSEGRKGNWKFCSPETDGKCSGEKIKNDVLPSRAVLHVHGKGELLEICSNQCGTPDSIWIKKGGKVRIGSGMPGEITNDHPATTAEKMDPHFRLYYKTRPDAPPEKQYVPVDTSFAFANAAQNAASAKMRTSESSATHSLSYSTRFNYPEGSNCPPLRY